MPAPSSASPKRETRNRRISLEERSLIISVSPQAYAEVLARLDMPPKPNERLRKTMRTPAPWDKA